MPYVVMKAFRYNGRIGMYREVVVLGDGRGNTVHKERGGNWSNRDEIILTDLA